MDEVKGRKIAAQMGIRIMGTVGILLLAYDTGILSAEDIEATVALLRNANRHISEKLFEQLLDKISHICLKKWRNSNFLCMVFQKNL